MSDFGLTPKQIDFIEQYLIDLNGTQAAIRSGYAEDSAHVIASKLLSNAKISRYLKVRMRERMSKLGITQERVLKEISLVAFSNMKNLARWEGESVSLKDSETMEDDISASVSEVSSTSSEKGSSTKIKLHDKMKALEMLAKHTGLYLPDEDAESKPDRVIMLKYNLEDDEKETE